MSINQANLLERNFKFLILNKSVVAHFLKRLIPFYREKNIPTIIRESLDNDLNPDPTFMSPLFLEDNIFDNPYFIYQIEVPPEKRRKNFQKICLCFILEEYDPDLPTLFREYTDIRLAINTCNQKLKENDYPELLFWKIPIYAFFINTNAPADTLDILNDSFLNKQKKNLAPLFDEKNLPNNETKLNISVINLQNPSLKKSSQNI